MKILIIGAGAIGIGLGNMLFSQGAAISYLASERTKAAIDADGIRLFGLFGEFICPPWEVKAYTKYEDLPQASFDLVIISSKTMANDEISQKLNAARACLKPGAKIVIFQNGWGNDQPYRRFFAPDEVFCARIITGFKRSKLNTSEVTVHTEPVMIGSLYGCDNSALKPLAEMLSKAGLPTELTNEVGKALWAKMLYNTTLNPLGAILNLHYGALTEDEYSRAIMDELIDETFAVIKAAGFETFWQTPDQYRELFYGKLVPDTYNHRSSTLQDIERRQKTEIDTLNGKILELAQKHGVNAPAHRMIYRLIKSIESRF
jgi:2-dehydropantoate 2-reductase